MNLILWRHAQAEQASDGQYDASRVLTRKGQKQAEHMATWLERHLPASTRIISSPAMRCVQTVEALRRNYRTRDELWVNAGVDDVLSLVKWPEQRRPVLLVGHQPWIGRVIGHLVQAPEGAFSVKKGSVHWLQTSQREADWKVRILTAQCPDLL